MDSKSTFSMSFPIVIIQMHIWYTLYIHIYYQHTSAQLASRSCSVSPTHCFMSLISPGGLFVSKCNCFCLLWSNSCLGTQNLSLWVTACVWGQKSTENFHTAPCSHMPVRQKSSPSFFVLSKQNSMTHSYWAIKTCMCMPGTNVLAIKIIVWAIYTHFGVWDNLSTPFRWLKEIVSAKIKILSSFTHLHAVPK